MRELRPWHKSPREVVDTPFLEVLETRMNRALNNLVIGELKLEMVIQGSFQPKPFWLSAILQFSFILCKILSFFFFFSPLAPSAALPASGCGGLCVRRPRDVPFPPAGSARPRLPLRTDWRGGAALCRPPPPLQAPAAAPGPHPAARAAGEPRATAWVSGRITISANLRKLRLQMWLSLLSLKAHKKF